MDRPPRIPVFTFRQNSPCPMGGCTGSVYPRGSWEHEDGCPIFNYSEFQIGKTFKRLWSCTGDHWCWQYFST
jgi:hypothetical protein